MLSLRRSGESVTHRISSFFSRQPQRYSSVPQRSAERGREDDEEPKDEGERFLDSRSGYKGRSSHMRRLYAYRFVIAALFLLVGFLAYNSKWLAPASGRIVRPVFDGGVAAEKDPDPNRPKRQAIVLASYSNQNLTWLSELSPKWEIYPYKLDDPNPHSELSVPRNQGREAMAYLTFIIDHYHDLPDYVVFHHGARRAWHQIEPAPMKIEGLNLTALDQEKYINLRCAHAPGCTDKSFINVKHPDSEEKRPQALLLPGFWNTIFDINAMPKPERLMVTCCAQFAVTKDAILAQTHDWWKMFRQPMERDLGEYKSLWGYDVDSYKIGMLYEKVWHIVFGKPAKFCPSEETCRKVFFSNSATCNKYTGPFQDSDGWQDWTSCDWTDEWKEKHGKDS